MKAICQNHYEDKICETYLYEKEFEVKDLDVGVCPECGGKDIAPAWIKNYRIPGEVEAHKKLQGLVEERKQLDKVIVNY